MTSRPLALGVGAVVALSILLAAVLAVAVAPALRIVLASLLAVLAVLVGLGFVLFRWIRTELEDANDPSQLEFEARLEREGVETDSSDEGDGRSLERRSPERRLEDDPAEDRS